MAALKILQQHLQDIEQKQKSLNSLQTDIIRSIARLELLLQQSKDKLHKRLEANRLPEKVFVHAKNHDLIKKLSIIVKVAFVKI